MTIRLPQYAHNHNVENLTSFCLGMNDRKMPSLLPVGWLVDDESRQAPNDSLQLLVVRFVASK